MAKAGVNLDALIERADLAEVNTPLGGKPTGEVTISNLKDEIFYSGLRKPDFQRETASWSPQKIAEMIASFLDGDLIPAIILWRSGHLTFVIDGAHRISAMLAWIFDDYGDKSRSIEFFDNFIPEEQQALARKTRELVNSTVGSYASFQDLARSRKHVPDDKQVRLANFTTNSFVVQWVPQDDADGAERSFFKINQAPTPVDPIEKMILKGRMMANAIASRAINRGGTGHKYWGHFSEERQQEISSLGKEINRALYSPPLSTGSIRTSDVPMAGAGYSSLPFIFDLVNLVNGVSKGEIKDPDPDGTLTLSFMRSLRDRLELVTTDHPGSLGLHPLVYFYTRGGAFQPVAFLAAVQVFHKLRERKKFDRFCDVRERFERFLMIHKEAFTLLVKSQGSGPRSRPAIEAFLERTLETLWEEGDDEKVVQKVASDTRFGFLMSPQPVRGEGTSARTSFSSSVKSAAYMQNLLSSGVRCGICGGLVHRNSISSDHVQRRADGGNNSANNAQLAHPYCNSGYKERLNSSHSEAAQ
jgi:hypothetical protein